MKKDGAFLPREENTPDDPPSVSSSEVDSSESEN